MKTTRRSNFTVYLNEEVKDRLEQIKKSTGDVSDGYTKVVRFITLNFPESIVQQHRKNEEKLFRVAHSFHALRKS